MILLSKTKWNRFRRYTMWDIRDFIRIQELFKINTAQHDLTFLDKTIFWSKFIYVHIQKITVKIKLGKCNNETADFHQNRFGRVWHFRLKIMHAKYWLYTLWWLVDGVDILVANATFNGTLIFYMNNK